MWNNTSDVLIKHMALPGTNRGRPTRLTKKQNKRWVVGKCNVDSSRTAVNWGFFSSKFVCIRESTKMPHTCFFPSSPLLPPFAPLPSTSLPPPPVSAESHYRNTISNTSAQVFDRLQTNLYSGGKQKAAEIYLLSVEERNKAACEPWVTSELTWRWISAPCKCMERRDILHSVIQHIAACRIPLTPTAGTIFLCCKNAVRSCSLRWIIL